MKIGAIIQARYQSSRLPGKVLLPLPFPSGEPLLQHIIDKALLSKFIDKLCIATSGLKENDVIVDFANKQGIDVFRGDEDDVLNRFIELTRKHNFDIVVRLTGDNPLLDVERLDESIQYHIKEGNDYTDTQGLPLGMNFEILDANALLKLESESLTKEDKEHVTKFIIDNKKYKKSTLKFNTRELCQLRCTIDYPSDFAMMNTLIPLLNSYDNVCSQILSIQRLYPWVFRINENNNQVKFFTTLEEELNTVLPLLKQLEMKHTLNLLNRYSS